MQPFSKEPDKFRLFYFKPSLSSVTGYKALTIPLFFTCHFINFELNIPDYKLI
jgi:hypothetical protein